MKLTCWFSYLRKPNYRGRIRFLLAPNGALSPLSASSIRQACGLDWHGLLSGSVPTFRAGNVSSSQTLQEYRSKSFLLIRGKNGKVQFNPARRSRLIVSGMPCRTFLRTSARNIESEWNHCPYSSSPHTPLAPSATICEAL